jgi:hypothetical protein
MSSNRHGLNVTKPVSLLNKSIKFSFRDFFKSMSKAGCRVPVPLFKACGRLRGRR